MPMLLEKPLSWTRSDWVGSRPLRTRTVRPVTAATWRDERIPRRSVYAKIEPRLGARPPCCAAAGIVAEAAASATSAATAIPALAAESPTLAAAIPALAASRRP